MKAKAASGDVSGRTNMTEVPLAAAGGKLRRSYPSVPHATSHMPKQRAAHGQLVLGGLFESRGAV